MKRVLKKFLIVLLIVITLNNFFLGNYTYAVGAGEAAATTVIELIEDIFGTVVGILAIIPKLVALAVGAAINGLTAAVAYSANDSLELPAISPFDIIFNKVDLVKIDFFNIVDDGSIVMTIRQGVATWYYVMRIIASGILLVILIYVGIRMAISTVADDKAMYKKMLVDWCASLALVFLLQYIIIFTLTVNNAIIDALSTFMNSNSDISTGIEHAYLEIFKMSLGIDIESIAATIIYCILVWQTLGLFISYFNRMLKLAFLIIIAPLITLTYSIDKMGDGKAQALGTWLREFVFTILLQPFHCVIYMSMINIAFSFLIGTTNGTITDKIPVIFDAHNNSLSYAIIAILCVLFVKEAEKIVRKIFQFQDDGSTGLDKGLIASTALLKFSGKAGVSTAKGINNAKNFIAQNPERMRNIKADAMVAASFLGKKGKDGQALTGTREERKDQALTQLEEKDSEKIIQKLNKESKKQVGAYGIDGKGKYTAVAGKDNEKLAKIAESLRDADPSLSAGRAMARARLQVANDAKKDQKRRKTADFNEKHRRIGRARTVMKELNSLDTVKDLKRLAVKEAGLGVALFTASGGLGTGQGLTQSIMIGTGTYNAFSQINKNTSKTLAESASKNFSALNCKDSIDIRKILNEVAMNSDSFKDNSDEVRELLDNLKNSLKQLDGDINVDEKSKRIHNKIRQAISKGKNPDIDSILAQELGVDNAKNTDVISATNSLNIHENKKAVLDAYNAAQSAGIGTDVFISQAADSLDTSLAMATMVSASGQQSSKDSSQDAENAKTDAEKEKEELARKLDEVKRGVEKSINPEEILSDEEKELEEKYIREFEKEKERLEKDMEHHLGYGYDVIDQIEIDRLKQAIAEHQKAIDEFDTAQKELQQALDFIEKNASIQGDSIMQEAEINAYINVNISGASTEDAKKLQQSIQTSAERFKKVGGDLSTQQQNIVALAKQIELNAQQEAGKES